MIATSLPYKKAIRPKVKAKIFRKRGNSVQNGISYTAKAVSVLPLYNSLDMSDDIFDQIKASVERVQNKPDKKYHGCV